MDAELINPFINATINVVETMAFIKPKAGKPYLKKVNTAEGDVTGLMGITGETTGTIAVTFKEESIVKIVSNMFQEEIKELNQEVTEAVGELTNIISGHARRELEENGRVFEGAVPSVITGKNHEITHITEGPIIAIPFTIHEGEFTLELCMEK